jgi:hypothetical protein
LTGNAWLAGIQQGDRVAYLVKGIKPGEVDMGVSEVGFRVGDRIRLGCPGAYMVSLVDGPWVDGPMRGRIYRVDRGIGLLIRVMSRVLVCSALGRKNFGEAPESS